MLDSAGPARPGQVLLKLHIDLIPMQRWTGGVVPAVRRKCSCPRAPSRAVWLAALARECVRMTHTTLNACAWQLCARHGSSARMGERERARTRARDRARSRERDGVGKGGKKGEGAGAPQAEPCFGRSCASGARYLSESRAGVRAHMDVFMFRKELVCMVCSG